MDQQDISPKNEADRETIGANDSRQKACDPCRARKIRCNKETPCSNCRVADRSCIRGDFHRQPRKPRQRVAVSTQYELKIDKIGLRLSNIEGILRAISQRSASAHSSSSPLQYTTPQQHLTVSAPGTFAASVADDQDSEDDESAIRYDSAIVDHATGAREDLEHAISSITIDNAGPELHDALLNLKLLVELQNRQSVRSRPRFPLQQPLPAGGLGQLPLPPVNVVVGLLKYAQGILASPPGLFTIISSYVGIHDFMKLCQTVYFPAQDVSHTIYTIVIAGLYYLFLEQHILASAKATKEEFASYMHICSINLETSLANASVFACPKIETVQALLLGTLYAVHMSRPTVAWFLNSTAANICQIAGFHRHQQSASETPAAKLKSALFWQTYINDRALALGLHRAPMIQDYDIGIPRAFSFEGPMGVEMSGVALMWLKMAAVQGQVYEKLYSPAALALPRSQLAERARVLGAECRRLELEAGHHRAVMARSLEGTAASSLIPMYIKGDEVQLFSTMTLIYRAIPPPLGSRSRFCDECVGAARSAMQRHLECMATINSDISARSIYIHWNLALTHFTPIFVLFSYVIETLSVEDIQLLHTVGASLEGCAKSSETIQKVWRLCEVLCRITRLYVDIKTQEQENQLKVLGDRFDAYLDQLGLVSMEREGVADMGGVDLPALDDFQAADLASWIAGSQDLMGLAEQDVINLEGYSFTSADGP
ncbi:hypothetical protein LCI18_003043 [Fusarium solani-melongenae]|uniref:Uncharacterized protein n=1 Tax=Fusarium solani subsp. cucurbitae TaxID=2747967 RepID=A0ACD3YT15_FUSSC|nr:hypothetical protein LCI18_003043 [Fusarium solani-melongenae]